MTNSEYKKKEYQKRLYKYMEDIKDIISNEEEIEEGVKWFKDGKLVKDPNIKDDIEENEDFITDTKFKEFLLNHNAYGEYVRNVQERHPYIKTFEQLQRLTNDNYFGAFQWSKTPEGRHYWATLDKLWSLKKDRSLSYLS